MTAATNGIRNPSRPGRWLVPPWDPAAGVCEVVGHFLRFEPWHPGENRSADRLAYYEGLAVALDNAATDDMRRAGDLRWYADVKASVARCITACRAAT